MQFAKDSFYMTLRARLASRNPLRTVVVSGVTRPAIVVVENELPGNGERLPNTFYIEWGESVAVLDPQVRRVRGMMCRIGYFTCGNVESGVDRGRMVGELDSELLAICNPACTGKQDYTQSPSVNLGTGMFWTYPKLGAVNAGEKRDGAAQGRMERVAEMAMYFYPEVAA